MPSVKSAAFRGVLLFLAALLGVLLARLPLRWATPLLPASLHCEAPLGSLWDGHCGSLSVRGGAGTVLLLGEADWVLRPTALFKARLGLDLRLRRGSSEARGRLELGFGSLSVTGLEAQGPMNSQLLPGFPPTWTGQLQVVGGALRLEGGKLVGLAGTAVAQDLVAQSPQRLAYGSYQLRFLPAAGGELPVGEVNDQGGPLELHARLLLKPSLQWSLEGQVSARPAADPALAQLLQSLSPPDAKGLRPFSVGSL